MLITRIRNAKHVARVLAVTVAAALLATPSTLAHGGAAEIFRGKSGPYQIIVAATPSRMTTGQAHLSIVVADASTGDNQTDATVTVTATGPNGERTGPEAASPSFGGALYEANLALPVPGMWRFTVTAVSPAGEGIVEQRIEVREPTLPWGTILQWGVPALMLLGIAAWGRFGPRRNKQRTTTRRN